MSQTLEIDVKNTTLSALPKVSFEALAKRALPQGYQLSVVICADKLSRSLNKKHRNKDYIPNVLSFPISKKSGEIFLNIRQATRESSKYGRKPQEHILALYVHGLVHLTGLDHGKKMDELEKKLTKF